MKKEWWKTFFDERYLKTYANVDIISPAATQEQILFLIKSLRLKKGARILDLACGYGRHSIPLAKRGYQVTGIDFSGYFIRLAKKNARKEGVQVEFIKNDMRNLNFINKFDAIIHMFTSFGYFKDEKDNILVIQKISHALKPGGKLFMDLANPVLIFKHMIERDTEKKQSRLATKGRIRSLSNGLQVFLKEELDPVTMRWFIIREWNEKGKTHKNYTSDIRLYSFSELKHLLEENGFRIQKVWGNFDGSPFDINSNRMLILAQKK